MTEIDFEDLFVEEPDPIEDETDLEVILRSDLSNAIVQSTDWTIDTLVNQIEKGRIQLDPDFQRRDAWTNARKSKFIESLFLGFPIPQLVLAESKRQKGKYMVIDGKQRLLSLIKFAGSEELRSSFGEYKLSGLSILDKLNGKTFDQIESGDLGVSIDEFEGKTIRTIVIRHWEHESILYHIFLRLNTGSVQLSPQELRNALHPGPFARFVDSKSADSPALRKILKLKKPDFRMRDAELLLRYFSFVNFMPSYSGSMKQFLDHSTETLNDKWDSAETEITSQYLDFELGVEAVYEIFGNDSFRKYKDGSFVSRVNRAIYDIMLFYFRNPHIRDRAIAKSDDVLNSFINLSTFNPEFVESVETTTKSLGSTVTRFSSWTKTLNDTLNIDLPIPTLRQNRIHF